VVSTVGYFLDGSSSSIGCDYPAREAPSGGAVPPWFDEADRSKPLFPASATTCHGGHADGCQIRAWSCPMAGAAALPDPRNATLRRCAPDTTIGSLVALQPAPPAATTWQIAYAGAMTAWWKPCQACGPLDDVRRRGDAAAETLPECDAAACRANVSRLLQRRAVVPGGVPSPALLGALRDADGSAFPLYRCRATDSLSFMAGYPACTPLCLGPGRGPSGLVAWSWQAGAAGGQVGGWGAGRTWLMAWSGVWAEAGAEAACVDAGSLVDGAQQSQGGSAPAIRWAERQGQGPASVRAAAGVQGLLSSASLRVVLAVPVGQLNRIDRRTMLAELSAEAAAAAGAPTDSCTVVECAGCPDASNGTVWSNRSQTVPGRWSGPVVPGRHSPLVPLALVVRFLPVGVGGCQPSDEASTWEVDASLTAARDSPTGDPVAFTGPGSNGSWAGAHAATAAAAAADRRLALLAARSAPAVLALSLRNAVRSPESHRVVGAWLVWADPALQPADAPVRAVARCLFDPRLADDATADQVPAGSWWWHGGAACPSATGSAPPVIGAAIVAAVIALVLVTAFAPGEGSVVCLPGSDPTLALRYPCWWCCLPAPGALSDNRARLARRAAASRAVGVRAVLPGAARCLQTATLGAAALVMAGVSLFGVVLVVTPAALHIIAGTASAAVLYCGPGSPSRLRWTEDPNTGRAFAIAQADGDGDDDAVATRSLRQSWWRRLLADLAAHERLAVLLTAVGDPEAAAHAASNLARSRGRARRFRQLSVPVLGLQAGLLRLTEADTDALPMTWRVWLGLPDTGGRYRIARARRPEMLGRASTSQDSGSGQPRDSEAAADGVGLDLTGEAFGSGAGRRWQRGHGAASTAEWTSSAAGSSIRGVVSIASVAPAAVGGEGHGWRGSSRQVGPAAPQGADSAGEAIMGLRIELPGVSVPRRTDASDTTRAASPVSDADRPHDDGCPQSGSRDDEQDCGSDGDPTEPPDLTAAPSAAIAEAMATGRTANPGAEDDVAQLSSPLASNGSGMSPLSSGGDNPAVEATDAAVTSSAALAPRRFVMDLDLSAPPSAALPTLGAGHASRRPPAHTSDESSISQGGAGQRHAASVAPAARSNRRARSSARGGAGRARACVLAWWDVLMSVPDAVTVLVAVWIALTLALTPADQADPVTGDVVASLLLGSGMTSGADVIGVQVGAWARPQLLLALRPLLVVVTSAGLVGMTRACPRRRDWDAPVGIVACSER